MKATAASRSQSVSATMASTAIRWASMGFLVLSGATSHVAWGTPVNPALTVRTCCTIRRHPRIRRNDAWGETPLARRNRSRILHHPVVDLAVAERDDVERVILIQPPR